MYNLKGILTYKRNLDAVKEFPEWQPAFIKKISFMGNRGFQDYYYD